MDIMALAFAYSLLIFLDILALKYRSLLILVVSGIISLLALGESAADNSFDTWHFLNNSSVIVNGVWTPTSDVHSWQLMMLVMSAITIVHFAMVIQMQMAKEPRIA